ncbi:MAG TPA: biotin/lipoyl-containing protein [Gaiellaceae bacterium]|jgi:pyruvate/2-oxoglutarate dehydrogenase complex dihydrolipoamide acyltransferase (E2) component|nr:biotin/lipoyl-containing protein [Gaiellaceae bacterium]
MAEVVKLPKWGLTMEEGAISEWLVGVGEWVDKGQILASVESEKVTIELPSPVSGIVAKYLVGLNEPVPVGTDLVLIVADEAEYARYTEGT